MTWLQTGPTFALTLLVFFAPGLAILTAAGVRRLNLVALAAPVSFTVASVLALVLGKAGIPFNPLSYFAASAALSLLAYALRYVLRRRAGLATSGADFGVLGANSLPAASSKQRWTRPLILVSAVGFPALIVTYRYLKGFGVPDNLSQTFDNVYHLNAVRFIADHQMGSSLTLGNLTDASAGFYPAAMHDLMALVFMMGSPSVMQAINIGTVVIGALVWPLSCIFLVTRIIGNRPAAVLLAGVLSAGFSAFPYLMVAFGVLYPNHAAIALLPAALGLVIELLGLSRVKPTSFWPPLLALAAVGPGLALAHPSAVVALIGFASPLVLARLIRSWQGFRKGLETGRNALLWLGFTVVYLIVGATVWTLVRPSLASAPWTPFQSNARALGEVLASAPMGTTAAWVLLICTIIGIYVIARRLNQFWWVLGMYAIGGTLYIIVSAWGLGDFRTFWTGVWYNDSFRLAALLPTVTLPVAVMGAEWLIFRLRAFCDYLVATGHQNPSELPGFLRPVASRLPAFTGIAASVIVIFMLGIAAQGGTLSNVQQRLDTIFVTNDNSYLLTADEMAMLKAVPDIVPPSDVVVANPRTGGSLVYAVSNRNTVAPHIFGDRTPAEQYLLDHWDEAAYNTKVCPLIHDLKAYWALDFGDFEVVPGDAPFTGLSTLADGSAPGMKLVKTIGKVHLYKVNACT
ncbi:DUF6541 family protein [Arthrobacter sp. FW306-2-2C-D06B]|uniref:DUF6541 family protein n=1 Tax=Arthrobacter sp. FW306-2-2C-D06B TaxID=2879618 RepID=UPI001F162746|nr:DUF6541 family protein [Arthrobacter sp. FW306-2-2C-D06B]UKA57526.1 hypothetical protein LFT47_14655 [Arthrobacter sp. FW306-2-2C-D06B]